MKTLARLIVVWLTCLTLVPDALMAKPSEKELEILDISAEPQTADWRYFHRMSDGERAKLWKYHASRQKKLSHWAWGWRLGWVRACAVSRAAYCATVMSEALFDGAMVVRAEAAARLGERFAGTGNARVLTLLEKAYANKRNSRGGKPLFVQYRILYAIRQIGGDGATSLGERLAGRGSDEGAYWQSLQKM